MRVPDYASMLHKLLYGYVQVHKSLLGMSRRVLSHAQPYLISSLNAHICTCPTIMCVTVLLCSTNTPTLVGSIFTMSSLWACVTPRFTATASQCSCNTVRFDTR
jgi:hypothetical protein